MRQVGKKGSKGKSKKGGREQRDGRGKGKGKKGGRATVRVKRTGVRCWMLLRAGRRREGERGGAKKEGRRRKQDERRGRRQYRT